jgi:ABC-2 type transport system ATP-binding protein
MTNSAVSIHNLSHRFRNTQALRNLTLQFDKGEIYGLIGPDGAGKTTTMRLISGLIDPQEGQVRVLGFDPRDENSHVREKLGYMPQRYSLYGDLSIEENLIFFGNLFCLSSEVYKKRVQRLLEITRLAPFTQRRADALSGGMYKKLALSCALLHEPQVLLLDEPTNGVDPVSRIELWDLMYTFRDEGMSILVSTSYMDEAARCSRVGLLHEGSMLAEGVPEDLIKEHLPSSETSIPHFEDLFFHLMQSKLAKKEHDL